MANKITGKGGAIFQSDSTSSVISDATALGDIKSFEVNITGDTVDVTAFSKTGAGTNAKEFEPALYGWEVTANGVMAKEVPVVDVNSKYRLLMREANYGVSSAGASANWMFFTGIGICTGNVEGLVVDGEATRNFTFQGTGEISATYSTTLTFK